MVYWLLLSDNLNNPQEKEEVEVVPKIFSESVLLIKNNFKGKSNVKIYGLDSKVKVSFKDVAGLDEAKLEV